MTEPAIVRGADLTEYYFHERCHVLEHWNRADDPHSSIARIRVEPGTTTRLHSLRGTSERYVILQGRGTMYAGDLAPSEVGPGDTVFIPADAPQRIANTGDGDLIFLAICTPRFVPECYQDLEADG
jgi:mannose-6-phosphate isomerase-like protein (cupin superfamily)